MQKSFSCFKQFWVGLKYLTFTSARHPFLKLILISILNVHGGRDGGGGGGLGGSGSGSGGGLCGYRNIWEKFLLFRLWRVCDRIDISNKFAFFLEHRHRKAGTTVWKSEFLSIRLLLKIWNTISTRFYEGDPSKGRGVLKFDAPCVRPTVGAYM